MTYPPAAAAAEVAAVPGVIAMGAPVRIDEPMGKSATYLGDGRGPGLYIPFYVCALYHGTALPATPIRETALIIRCYGRSRAEAWVMWLTVEPTFRNRRARTVSGLGIWNSSIVPGSVLPDTDPQPPTGTGQPVVYAIVNYPSTI